MISSLHARPLKLRILPRRIAQPPQRPVRETPTRSRSGRTRPLRGARRTAGPRGARRRPRRVALLQRRAHQPVQLHAHAVDGRVCVQHLVLSTLALVDDHHVGATVELGERIGDAADFVAEGLVEGEEVVHLRIEGGLAGVGQGGLQVVLGHGRE